jgi:hypothetical protein
MDTTEPRRGGSEDSVRSNDDIAFQEPKQELPDDLPKSLDDRRSVPVFHAETEMYDAWQGEQQKENERAAFAPGLAG